MKREVHSECHHEKGSEGSRKGERYARRHAKFRHLPAILLRIYSRSEVGMALSLSPGYSDCFNDHKSTYSWRRIPTGQQTELEHWNGSLPGNSLSWRFWQLFAAGLAFRSRGSWTFAVHTNPRLPKTELWVDLLTKRNSRSGKDSMRMLKGLFHPGGSGVIEQDCLHSRSGKTVGVDTWEKNVKTRPKVDLFSKRSSRRWKKKSE